VVQLNGRRSELSKKSGYATGVGVGEGVAGGGGRLLLWFGSYREWNKTFSEGYVKTIGVIPIDLHNKHLLGCFWKGCPRRGRTDSQCDYKRLLIAPRSKTSWRCPFYFVTAVGGVKSGPVPPGSVSWNDCGQIALKGVGLQAGDFSTK